MNETTEAPSKPKLVCGLIMPISAIDGCSAEHWSEVKSIFTEAIEKISSPAFSVKLVSDADDVGVIQKRIVQNLYSADIVVCDVSGKNSNVMFELGMRLAFDKPTIIVKDDKTDYSFDTGVIEHIPYPRDLRFSRIVSFKMQLAQKIQATYLQSQSEQNHSTFLKNFGQFQVATVSESIVSSDKVVLEMLQDLQLEVTRIRRSINRDSGKSPHNNASSMAAIAAGINAYRKEKPGIGLRHFLQDEIAQSDLVRYCDAPKYFDSHDEFRAAIEEYVRNAIRLESTE